MPEPVEQSLTESLDLFDDRSSATFTGPANPKAPEVVAITGTAPERPRVSIGTVALAAGVLAPLVLRVMGTVARGIAGLDIVLRALLRAAIIPAAGNLDTTPLERWLQDPTIGRGESRR